MLGGPDMFVETGSVINMTCSVAWTPAPPASTSWRHNNSLISFRGPRPGVSIIIDKGEITTAQLLIMSARSEMKMVIRAFMSMCLGIFRSSDSGVYTCVPSNAPSANVTLHVLTGNFGFYIFTMRCNIRHPARPGADICVGTKQTTLIDTNKNTFRHNNAVNYLNIVPAEPPSAVY